MTVSYQPANDKSGFLLSQHLTLKKTPTSEFKAQASKNFLKQQTNIVLIQWVNSNLIHKTMHWQKTLVQNNIQNKLTADLQKQKEEDKK